jgi:hypothetical protein
MRAVRELEAWQSLDELSDRRDVGNGFEQVQLVLDSFIDGGCILFILPA